MQKELETISNELKVTAQPRVGAGARATASNGPQLQQQHAAEVMSSPAKASLLQSASSQRNLLNGSAADGFGSASPSRVGFGASAVRRMSFNELDGSPAFAADSRASELSALASDPHASRTAV